MTGKERKSMLDEIYHNKDKKAADAVVEKMASYKLKTVLAHLGMSAFDYDIAKDTVYIPKDSVLLHDFTDHWFADGGDYYYLEDLTGKLDSLVRDSFREAAAKQLEQVRTNTTGKIVSFDIPLVYKNKNTRWTNFIVDTIADADGKPSYAAGYCKDIHAQKKELYRVYKVAQTDVLTGLRNRTTTIYKVDERIHEDGSAMHFMAVLDLDKFKEANDLFGHTFGDQVLKNVADRIRKVEDHDTICCRTGGDEFMFFRKCDSVEHAMQIAARLKSEIRHSIPAQNRTFHVEASIGFSMHPTHGCTFDELYNKADIAMYYAKQHKTEVPILYTDSMADIAK